MKQHIFSLAIFLATNKQQIKILVRIRNYSVSVTYKT